MSDTQRVLRSRYVENFPVTVAGTQQYFFPDMSEVRRTPIYGIRMWDVNDVPFTRQGNVPVATADLKKTYLILYFQGGEFITIPALEMVTIRDSVTAGTNHPFSQSQYMLSGQVMDWSKSYFWIANTAGLTTGRYFHACIDYDPDTARKLAAAKKPVA